MTRTTRALALPARRPGYHPMFAGNGFTAQDCVCRLVRESPASQNVFRRHRVAVIIGGAFHYESDFGATLLAPGSMLLGRAGGGYCFRHVDDRGDRSVTFDFSDELLEDVRRSAGVRFIDRTDFRVPSIPASRQTAAAVALTQQALRLNDPELWEEAALLVAANAVTGAARTEEVSKGRQAARHLTDAEHLSIVHALRHIETHYQRDCSLRVLVDGSGMSIYRFLRLFKSLTSQTPRQYLLAMRLTASLNRLIQTPDRVLEIAYEVGFGDISHFNQVFGATFGVSPKQFRRRHRDGTSAVTASS